ncbi:MAG: hypothetical protein NWR72_16085 [Bacteroidia bacterium]|nr:hypothetical protein [Bacteroidia bacterium]
MAYWYRKQLPQTIMVWKKPEMVIVTITFIVAALILFIVGISSFFSWLDIGHVDAESIKITPNRMRDIGFICVLLLFALGCTYTAIKMLLVRVITESGIVANDRILRVPDFRTVIQWEAITDYYLLSDYPNVIFTLIVQKNLTQFERISVRVPVFMRDEFEDLLETKIFSSSSSQAQADTRPQRFSEN